MTDAPSNDAETSPLKFWSSPAWRYFSRFFDHRPSLIVLVIVGALVTGLMAFPVIALIRYIVDTALPTAAFKGLVLAALALFALRFGSSSLMLGIRSLTARSMTRCMGRVRRHLSDLLVHNLSREDYTHLDLVRMHTKLIEDSSRLDRLFNALLVRFLPGLTAGAVLGVILFTISPLLSVILLTLAPFMLLITRLMGVRIRRTVRAFQDMFEVFSKRILFTLQHLDLVRVHATEEREAKESAQAIDRLSDLNYEMTMSYARHTYAQNTLMNLYAILFIMAGGGLVALDRLSLGGFVSFYVVANFLNGHVNRVIDVWPDFVAGRESACKLYDMVTGMHRLPYDGTERVSFDGTVELSGVSFRFDENGPPLLEDVNLNLAPGRVTGLTGRNGCGKTTVASLILGFYRPQEGRITASGVDYASVDFRFLRPRIGVVMQNPIFFQGTILENVTYGRDDLSMETVEACARVALAAEFIAGLPDGYDTYIGEGGVCLSGGQRQRLAIVRALCANPALLILDEVTNHMDQASVKELLDNLTALAPRTAILMIGHKPDEMKYCDALYEISDMTLHEKPVEQPSYS